MSDILIKNMEMPAFEHQSWDIRKGADGKWYMVDTNAETSDGVWHELVPVPPHGRCIDADEIIQEKHQHYEYLSDTFYVTVRDIELAPTIIPADPAEEG